MQMNLSRRLTMELEHFRSLKKNVKLILVSYAFFLIAYPLVWTFVNAYLWRSSQSLWTIAAYNFGHIIALPLGFYLNGLLLKKFHVLRLYFTGTVMQGISAIMVVFFPTNTLLNIFAFGLFYGLGAGLYWANKNYLSLLLTKNSNRVYYNGLEQSIDLFINTIVPAMAGWFIVITGNLESSNFSDAYKITMIVGFIFLFLSGLFIQFSKIEDVSIKSIFLKKPEFTWQIVRLFNVIYNIAMGLSLVISGALVLVLLGNEGVLGTLQTLTTLISAGVAYVIGRKGNFDNSWKLVGVGSVLFFAGALFLAGVFNWLGGLIYTIVVTLVWTFQWSPSYTIEMELMDKEESDPEKQYAFICDNELFFNIGRALGILVIAMLIKTYNEMAALRFAPIVVATIQLSLAFIVKYLSTRVKNTDAGLEIKRTKIA